MATRRSRRTQADKERFAEQRREQLEALQQQIVEASTKLVEGDQWQTWLRFASTFHSYSFGNQMLIMLQRPDASLVAGYRAWQAKGRQVQKGETGIRIMAPVLSRVDVLDKAGNRVLDENGKPKKASRIVNVKPATVFDVSQTAGEPIPEPPRPQLLKGEAPEGLWESLAKLIEDRGYQVRRADCGTANGITHFGERTVTVRPDVDDLQAIKTLIHEGGHVLLHEPEARNLADSGGLCRGQQEVEAESVAYLVASAHGLDTSDYSFAYVASWASEALQQADEGVTLADIITRTGQRVVKTAHTILDITQPAQALDDTTSALTAEVTAQIAEDRQAIVEKITADSEVETLAASQPRIHGHETETQTSPVLDKGMIAAGWDDKERLARAMLSTAIEPGDPTVLTALQEAGDALTLVATLRGLPDRRLPPGWPRRLVNVWPVPLVNLVEEYGLRFIMPTDAEWPTTLDGLATCSPLSDVEGPSIGLWVAGHHNLKEFIDNPLTITEARASTKYGDKVASDLARELSASHTIVSGGGQGIDAAVHRGVMAAGGRTLIVYPGINSPLPMGHWGLEEHLEAGNMMVSEVGPRGVGRRDYLTCARILAAVSHGTVVVEAPGRGSAMTAAAWSRHLARPTMAVPGPVNSAMSTGCHTLIRNRQADLVTNADQVASAISQSQTSEPQPTWQRAVSVGLQDAVPAPTPDRLVAVFKEYDSVHHDDFEQAHDAVERIAAAGVIGAVHSVRTYDPNSIGDGEITYLTQAYETVVFANQQELDRWADINDLRAVEGRNDNDIMTSIDPCQHPSEGYLEVHDLYIARPATPTAGIALAVSVHELGRHNAQDALSAAFPMPAKTAMEPLDVPAGWRRQAPQGSVPALER